MHYSRAADVRNYLLGQTVTPRTAELQTRLTELTAQLTAARTAAAQLEDEAETLRIELAQLQTTPPRAIGSNARHLAGLLTDNVDDEGPVYCRLPADNDPERESVAPGECTPARMDWMADQPGSYGDFMAFGPPEELNELFVNPSGRVVGFVSDWKYFKMPPMSESIVLSPETQAAGQTLGGAPVETVARAPIGPVATGSQVGVMTSQLTQVPNPVTLMSAPVEQRPPIGPNPQQPGAFYYY